MWEKIIWKDPPFSFDCKIYYIPKVMSAMLIRAEWARANVTLNSSSDPVNESRIFHRSLFQIEGMRRGLRRMHADLCAVPVSGDSSGSSDLDRSGLRAGREWLRLQAEKHSELVHWHATGCTELLIFIKCHKCHKHFGLSRRDLRPNEGICCKQLASYQNGIERFRAPRSSNSSVISSMLMRC